MTEGHRGCPSLGEARKIAIPQTARVHEARPIKDSRDRHSPHRQRPAAGDRGASTCCSTPAGLDDAHLSNVLASIHTHEVDFADLYFQYSRTESWSLEEGIVKSGAFAIDRGVGVRAVRGDKQAFAYSDDISLLALDEAATAARAIGRQGQSARSQHSPRVGGARALYVAARSGRGRCPRIRKVALLERLEQMARARDPRVTQVMASLAGEYEAMLIARSDGLVAADVRPLVRVSLTVIVEENGRREQGSMRRRRPLRLRATSPTTCCERTPNEAVDQALLNLGARDAPAGNDDRRARPRAGPASCCTRRSATASKAISTARARARSPAASASASPRRASPSSMTARSSAAAGRSTSTTKATRRNARC